MIRKSKRNLKNDHAKFFLCAIISEHHFKIRTLLKSDSRGLEAPYNISEDLRAGSHGGSGFPQIIRSLLTFTEVGGRDQFRAQPRLCVTETNVMALLSCQDGCTCGSRQKTSRTNVHTVSCFLYSRRRCWESKWEMSLQLGASRRHGRCCSSRCSRPEPSSHRASKPRATRSARG